MDVRAELKSAGFEVTDIEPMGGGCVSAVYLCRTTGGDSIVAKVDESGAASLLTEAYMLRYLGEEIRLPVPPVHYAGEQLLVMAYVPGDSRFDAPAERHAAALLAELHNITSPTYGFPRDTLIGGLAQPNPAESSWLDFFREHRLLYMANEAARAGRMPKNVLTRLVKLCDNLDKWLTEPPQPALIHGDVWTTNVLAAGGRITAFLDPAIYFADAEIELAFTTLFHTFGPDFYARYHEIRPIAPGFFEERRDLYNLYPLLVHVRLFGGSYVSSVTRTLERFGF